MAMERGIVPGSELYRHRFGKPIVRGLMEDQLQFCTRQLFESRKLALFADQRNEECKERWDQMHAEGLNPEPLTQAARVQGATMAVVGGGGGEHERVPYPRVFYPSKRPVKVNPVRKPAHLSGAVVANGFGKSIHQGGASKDGQKELTTEQKAARLLKTRKRNARQRNKRARIQAMRRNAHAEQMSPEKPAVDPLPDFGALRLGAEHQEKKVGAPEVTAIM